MSDDLRQLVTEIAQLTEAPLPGVLDGDAPVLDREVSGEFYLIGIIGGKEVGKTALVNALAGQQLSPPTAWGEGTARAIAYAHEETAPGVRQMLEALVPGQHEVVTHQIGELRRQVLLDLPDVDSRYEQHVELTRKLLKKMLFPVWVQSVEKYADRRVQELLAAVAQGNDPANFVFVLNKADQAGAEAEELRTDYARRITRVLSMNGTPRVYLISATNPGQFELPALKGTLTRERSGGDVSRSIELAGKRRDHSILKWVDQQDLPARVQRLERLENEATELVASRLGVPLLERAIPAIMDDRAQRMALADDLMARRIARWPIVNMLHTLLGPIVSVYRANAVPTAPAEALLATYLTVNDRALSHTIQSTFAALHRADPAVTELYRAHKFWEDMPADAAEHELRRALAGAIERQRAYATQRLAGRGALGAPIRWLLTIGALIWFPFVQPVLEIALQEGVTNITKKTALIIVQILGVTYLLKSASFLIIWFLALWLAIRWDTTRRVNRLLTRWRTVSPADPSLNLAAATMAWLEDLTDPLRAARERAQGLQRRVDTARSAA